MRMTLFAALAATAVLAGPVYAQTAAPPAPSSPELEACKASGLIALKERAPAIKTITVDPDTVSISKTDTMVEQTKVRTVILGLATIDTTKKAVPNQFVCLIGDKGKVLLTFFTQK
jgi:nitrous oxide reductase accessory protein NosL